MDKLAVVSALPSGKAGSMAAFRRGNAALPQANPTDSLHPRESNTARSESEPELQGESPAPGQQSGISAVGITRRARAAGRRWCRLARIPPSGST